MQRRLGEGFVYLMVALYITAVFVNIQNFKII
jgi:hypothetical protein